MKVSRRFGVKAKPSKAKTYNKTEGELQELKEAIKKGAKLEEIAFWNKSEYWIRYKEGGAHRISKINYKKLNN